MRNPGKGLLLDLKRRGLVIGPEFAIADGALGFWQAIEEVWPKTRGQRCWVHKTATRCRKAEKGRRPRCADRSRTRRSPIRDAKARILRQYLWGRVEV
jgi:transposase-like protein